MFGGVFGSRRPAEIVWPIGMPMPPSLHWKVSE